jgi:membrane protease YdiL (CAAX protease family)
MALLPTGKKSRISDRDILLPLLVLYGVSYWLISQKVLPPTDQTLLFIKLLLGLVILTVPSLYILKRKSAYAVTLLPARTNWYIAGFAALLGFFLFYLLISIKLAFPNAFPAFLSYYGFFNPHGPLFFPLLLVITGYVMAEELFFRGVVYQYMRDKFGIRTGSLLAAVAFAAAHLNFYWPFMLYLAALSLVTIFLLERTNTFFYGFVVHAALDVLGFLLVSSVIGPLLYTHIFERTLVLALLVALSTWALFISRRFKRYGILTI